MAQETNEKLTEQDIKQAVLKAIQANGATSGVEVTKMLHDAAENCSDSIAESLGLKPTDIFKRAF